MKNKMTAAAILSLSVILGGCGSLDQIKEKYIEETTVEPTVSPEPKERVYMDQLSGKVQSFDGAFLSLSSEGSVYLFDASRASIETSHGLIAGDTVSVIYEGRLSGEDASGVQALKVVDELHKEEELTENVIEGTLVSLTQHSLTFTDKQNRRIVCPVPGTLQYYKNGIRTGGRLFIHYLGEIPDVDPGEGLSLEVPQIRVISVSDRKEVPETPRMTKNVKITNEYGDQFSVATDLFKGTVESFYGSVLQVVPEDGLSLVSADLSGARCYMPGGFSSGMGVRLRYAGGNGTGDITSATVYYAFGDDPADLKKEEMPFSVSGEVVGLTANTVTLKTADAVRVTFLTDSVPASGDLLYGNQVRITFDPDAARQTNILPALKITQ